MGKRIGDFLRSMAVGIFWIELRIITIPYMLIDKVVELIR